MEDGNLASRRTVFSIVSPLPHYPPPPTRVCPRYLLLLLFFYLNIKFTIAARARAREGQVFEKLTAPRAPRAEKRRSFPSVTADN